ncbi:hypothetical protein KUH03_01440 [Sphingobacterium sp. E70]|uniref:hypothetical protein n=1 Tax=Sphingobacterium sp. E70 TaxID=2853439 RepID=UPI00211C0256|nr:hypothetical protein [Sphingobacterium sp. E70]ULT25697.1 hypothetical protein KUH03_01440 [Sphingobacterium sp. E70]
MKAQIGLIITAVAGAALLVYRRWKQRSGQESTEQTDREQTGNLTSPPSWYRPLKMPDIDSKDIVSLQYAPVRYRPTEMMRRKGSTNTFRITIKAIDINKAVIRKYLQFKLFLQLKKCPRSVYSAEPRQ